MYEPISVTTQDGRNLEVYVAGPSDGMPVLYCHGTPGTGLPSDETVAALAARGLRYVAWSRPGYGGSTRQAGRSVAAAAADATDVLAHLGADKAYALGWSGGGPHALACAGLLPERIIGGATIASVGPFRADDREWEPDPDDRRSRAALAGPDALREELEPRWRIMRDITADQFVELVGDELPSSDRETLSPAFAEWIAALFRTSLRESYWGWLDDELAFAGDWGFNVAVIRVPVHIWHGQDDADLSHGQWLASRIPTARAQFPASHGHLSLHAGSAFMTVLDAMVDAAG